MTIREIAELAISNRLAIQHPDELTALLGRVREIEPHVVLEIGSAQGGSWWAFSQVAAVDALMISVDLPSDHRISSEWAQVIGVEPKFAKVSSNPDVLRNRLENSVRSLQTAVVIQGDSTTRETELQVLEALDGRNVDFLFIDGGHDYHTVRSDYMTFAPLVRDGGLVAFHDIAVTDHNLGAPQAWQQTLGDGTRSSRREYIAHNSPCGIGVLVMSDSLREQIKEEAST